MKAADLNCRGAAQAGALALERAFPAVVFTSGRRDLTAQARAMAQNVHQANVRSGTGAGAEWLRATYKPSAALTALLHDLASRRPSPPYLEIAAGFVRVLSSLPPTEAGRISRHLSGDAWDVQPVDGEEGDKILAAIRALPGLDTLLTHEGGLRRWHAQFHPPAATPATP